MTRGLSLICSSRAVLAQDKYHVKMGVGDLPRDTHNSNAVTAVRIRVPSMHDAEASTALMQQLQITVWQLRHNTSRLLCHVLEITVIDY